MDFYDLADTSVEQLYQALGQFVVDAIAEAWLSATACAEIEQDDNGLTYGRYIPAAAPATERSFKTGYRFYFVFKELRRRFHKPGHAPWVKARFTLYPDGHFDLDFTYPDAATRADPPSVVEPPWLRLKQSWLDAVEQGEAPTVSLQALFEPNELQTPAGLDVVTARGDLLSTTTFEGIPAGYDAAIIRSRVPSGANQAGDQQEEAV